MYIGLLTSSTQAHVASSIALRWTDRDAVWDVDSGYVDYCDDNLPSTANLFDDADNQLFRNILANGEHLLHYYMPQRTTLSHCHYLRPCKHNKELIPKTRTLNNKDFIVRMLYKDMY